MCSLIVFLLVSFYGMGILAACTVEAEGEIMTKRDSYKTGRLTAKPATGAKANDLKTGMQPLNLDGKKEGLIYIPSSYSSEKPAALAVMLHGAGANAEQGLSLLRKQADALNIILIAPASRAPSWDIISSRAFGPDVLYIDQALQQVFDRYAIETARVAVGGFSDGASYALTLGLTNGDLFTHILAFSPGFAHTAELHGNPAVFISHGIHDSILPIDPCSRRIVPQLQRQGFEVKYQEFDGPHTVPTEVVESAVAWFLKSEV
ncbi:Predicted esterase [Pontibacter akesuensis]|uniref:Predicted esterase n=2 Tax=Pontibacter akesuensis TaxID=388950 RepID=A0A1I7KSZ4_9BACT|nr:Predicted esterase [Pontibacter akesuensis]